MDDHVHKYYLFETKSTFEPIPGSVLYERIEYAIMSCNCTSVVKVKVKDNAK